MRSKALTGLLFSLLFAAVFNSQAVDVQVSTAGGDVTWSHSDTYINEVRLNRGTYSHGDGYDGAMQVQVSGSVQYNVELHFSSAYAMAIEYVEVVNPYSTAQTYSISCSGNLGSDGSTVWHYASASGPFYTISSDQASPTADGGDPVVSFLYGDGSLVGLGSQRSMPYTSGNDDHSFTVSGIVLPPGATHRYLFLGGAGDIDDTTYNRPSSARAAVLNLVDPANWPDDFTEFLSSDQLEEVVNWDILAEPLKILPDSEISFWGYPDGPFQSSNEVYTIQNRSDGALSWSVSSSESWLTVSPESGALGLDEVQEITVTLDDQVNDFPVGDHVATLTFSNDTLHEIYIRDVVVSVSPTPELPVDPEGPSPADGAMNVSAGTMLQWVHDSGNVPPSPLVNTTSTYTVYFGTNATDMAILASGLTNTWYDPGILDVDTTYYWQVVASNDVGSTTGAVWNFTTWVSGAIDHFDWEILTEQPRMYHPFDVAITARDIHGHTVFDYSNPAMVLAFRNTTNATVLLSEGFEGVDTDDWSLNPGVYTTNDNSFTGAECLFFTTNSSSAQLNHVSMQPDIIKFAVHADNASAYSYAIFSDSSYNDLAYFYMSDNRMFLYAGTIFESFPMDAGRWYQVSIHINWQEQLLEWYLDGVRMGSDLQFLDTGVNSLERMRVYSSSGNQVRFDDFQYQNAQIIAQQVPVNPAMTTSFESGVWIGQVEVDEYVSSGFLSATDSSGHSGRSDNFRVDYLGELALLFPDDLTEGDGLRSGEAQVTVSVPPPSNIVVSLSAASGAELEMPATVEIAQGETNAYFDVTILDDALLDGSQASSVSVTLADYRGSTSEVWVHDDETASLFVSLPVSTAEGLAYVSGVLQVDHAPDSDVLVQLLSDNPEKLQGGTVLIPAGETYVPFSLHVMNDYTEDGIQTATITAHVRNWSDSQASIFVMENEGAVLTVQVIPETVKENAGILTSDAYVTLAGYATYDVAVRLQSSDPSVISVPRWVTIPAGGTGARIELEVHDNGETDGARIVSILAEAPGYVLGADAVKVLDDELHHLAVTGLTEEVPLLEPVTITVSARTIDDYPTDAFDGTVSLSALGDEGVIDIEPSLVTNFVNGTASETVVFGGIGNEVRVFADGGIVQGTSAVFKVVAPRMMVSAPSLTNVQVVAGTTTSSSMSISNAGNATLEFTLTDASLQAYYPFDGDAEDRSGNGNDGILNGVLSASDRFGSPASAYRFDGSSAYIDAGTMGGFKTVSLWVKVEGLYRADYYFSHNDFRLYSSVETGNRLVLADGDTAIITTAQMGNYLNQWIHIVAISDGPNSGVYLNGNLVGSGTLGAVSESPVNLGRWLQGLHYFNGLLDDVRVYDRVLPEDEIRALYSEARLTAGLAASYPMNGNMQDISGNSRDGSAYSAVPVADRFGEANGAYQLNGSYSFLQLPSGSVSGMTECSLAMWVYPSQSVTWSRIFDFGSGENSYMFLTPRSNNGTLRFAISEVGYWSEEHINAPALSLNRWHHVVVTLGNGTGEIYVNGSRTGINSGMSLTPADLGTTIQNWIGRSQYAADPYWGGRIDDFRIYSRKLSSSEISALYAGDATEDGDEWLTVMPMSGSLPPGGSTNAVVAFDATDRIAGDHTNATLRISCNDIVTPKVELPVSMYVLPSSPVMDAEPEFTPGSSNMVAWSAVDGPVEYEVVVAAETNSTPIESSPWGTVTNHTFGGLMPNTVYFYRARASVSSGAGRLPGPWSEWVWSTQSGIISDLDEDNLPDWWEEMYLVTTDAGSPTADSDGDGQTNLDEYIAGMNPTNAAEYFMVEAMAPSTSGAFIISWNAVSGRVYNVYWTPSLGGTFDALETHISYPRNSYTDEVHHAESEGFYKVQVELENN